MKVTNNNRLTEDNIQNILKMFGDRIDVQYLCKLVHNSEVASNSYNLSVTSYVEKENTRTEVDVTELNVQIKEIVSKEEMLRNEIDKIIRMLEGKE